MTTKPTYAQALQWTLEKCMEARDRRWQYIELRKQSNCETGYMLLRHHKPRGKHWVRDDGNLDQWAKDIVLRLIEWELVQEPTDSDLRTPRDKPEVGSLEGYTF
jgi:hypothetical protein